MCLLYSCKLTGWVWSVGVESGIASGGWLDHYRWTRKKVCFLTLVNQVNGPLGGRSRVPNGLIREEGGWWWEWAARGEHRLTHLQPTATAPSSCQGHVKPPGRQLGHMHPAHWAFTQVFARTTVKCGFHVPIDQCERHVWKWHEGKVFDFSKSTCIVKIKKNKKNRLKMHNNKQDDEECRRDCYHIGTYWASV